MRDEFYCLSRGDAAFASGVIKIPQQLFVCAKNQQLLGFIKGEFEDPGYGSNMWARIDHLFVDSRFHRSGIGSKLLNAYIEYARRANAASVYLYSVNTDQARNFYAKHNFISASSFFAVENMYIRTL